MTIALLEAPEPPSAEPNAEPEHLDASPLWARLIAVIGVTAHVVVAIGLLILGCRALFS